jgi:hypothetical protein
MTGRKLALMLLAFIALNITIPATFAGEFDDVKPDTLELADKAYYNKEYDTAFDLYKPIAEQGNAEAQYRLGWMYLYGLGTMQSYPDAIDWLTKGANQGDPEASHKVAEMYDFGYGVEKNKMLSYMWYAICKRQLDDLEQKPTTYNPVVDMNIMREVLLPEEVEQATKLAASWKRLGPDGKPAAPMPNKPKNDDQFPLPGKPQY